MRTTHSMQQAGRVAVFAVILSLLLATTGCVSFNGPNDVRRAIAKQENLELEQEMGVTVGPLAIFAANVVAAPFVPMTADGIDWVSYGEYTARCNEPSAEGVCLRNLELPGWERIARICEPREEVIVMLPDEGTSLRKLLVVMREEDTVRIVKAEGNLEKIIERLLESKIIDDDVKEFLVMGPPSAPPASEDGSGMDELTEEQRRAVDDALECLDHL